MSYVHGCGYKTKRMIKKKKCQYKTMIQAPSKWHTWVMWYEILGDVILCDEWREKIVYLY